jgi:hypothetical protein
MNSDIGAVQSRGGPHRIELAGGAVTRMLRALTTLRDPAYIC